MIAAFPPLLYVDEQPCNFFLYIQVFSLNWLIFPAVCWLPSYSFGLRCVPVCSCFLCMQRARCGQRDRLWPPSTDPDTAYTPPSQLPTSVQGDTKWSQSKEGTCQGHKASEQSSLDEMSLSSFHALTSSSSQMLHVSKSFYTKFYWVY